MKSQSAIFVTLFFVLSFSFTNAADNTQDSAFAGGAVDPAGEAVDPTGEALMPIEDALAALDADRARVQQPQDAALARDMRGRIDWARQRQEAIAHYQAEEEARVTLEAEHRRRFAALNPDQQRAEIEENFEPFRADPQHSITCKGRRPGWPLPVFDNEWDPNLDPDNDDALQTICAKPQYGGRPPGPQGPRGIPGYCARSLSIIESFADFRSGVTPETRAARVAATPGAYHIDPSTKANVNRGQRSLRNARLELYCARRCWCTTWQGQTIRAYPYDRAAMPLPDVGPAGAGGYMVTIDGYDDYANPRTRRGHGTDLVRFFTIQGRPQVRTKKHPVHDFSTPDTAQYLAYVFTDKANSIECDNNVPLPTDIRMLPPLTWRHFETTTRLCAIAGVGGLSVANAGTFCRRPYSHYQLLTRLPILAQSPVEVSSIWWSDEFTPRLEWTWRANRNFASSIRAHCFAHCWCRGQRAQRVNVDPGFIELTEQTSIQKISTGLKTLFKPKGSSQRSIPTGPQNQGGRSHAQCVVNGVDYCADGPWDEDLVGPPPGLDPPMAKPAVRPLPENLPGTCGQTCDGPAADQCSGAATDSDCTCRLLGLPVARLLGFDPVGTAGYCIEMLVLQALLQSASTSRNLPKRDLVEMEGDWPCLCNTSYVSKGCCGSQDGIIWEDSRLKMGTLLGDL